MKCGIYKINIDNKVYIGQSVNIPERIIQHTSKLKNDRHYNYKMQEAYNKTKNVLFEIVLYCSSEYLDYYEETIISIYNSIDRGLNICSAGKTGRGLAHGSTKYSREDIICAFLLSLDISRTYKDISLEIGIPESTVRHIAGRETHFWLDEEFPEESKRLLYIKGNNLRTSAIRNLKKYKFTKILSPDGNIFVVENISSFAREHNLNANNLGNVLRGSRKSTSGWIGVE